MMGSAVPMLNLPIKIAIMKQVEEVYLPRAIVFSVAIIGLFILQVFNKSLSKI